MLVFSRLNVFSSGTRISFLRQCPRETASDVCNDSADVASAGTAIRSHEEKELRFNKVALLMAITTAVAGNEVFVC